MTELFAGRQATGWCWQRAVAVPRELLAVLAAQEATEALPPGCVSWAGRSSSGSSRCSAAPGLRALGRFGATADGKICAPCMIREVRAAKAAPSWQDLRAVRSRKAVCGAFRMHGAHILPKPARFGYMARRSCQEGAIFPPEATFGMHGAQNLPRIAARERIAREYCHYQSPENAFAKILPWTNAWIRPAPNNCRPPRKKNGAEGRTWRTPPPEARKTECWRGWGEQRVRRGAAPSPNTRERSAAKYRHGR